MCPNYIVTCTFKIRVARVCSRHASIVQSSPIWTTASVGPTVTVQLTTFVIVYKNVVKSTFLAKWYPTSNKLHRRSSNLWQTVPIVISFVSFPRVSRHSVGDWTSEITNSVQVELTLDWLDAWSETHTVATTPVELVFDDLIRISDSWFFSIGTFTVTGWSQGQC